MTQPSANRDDRSKVGSLIANRYRIEAQIATGGMAEVFAVTDRGGTQKLALKRLRSEVLGDARITTLFRLEFHTLARLSHPNIIQVFDFGVDEGRPFYTMEWLDGLDLNRLVPIEPMRACALLCDVVASLSLLHGRRLIHRDVSARNVRLTQAGRCKLLDFGAMAHFGAAPDIVGTPPMVAPECVRGGLLDQRTDLFAVGALAYHMLTGRHAYPAKEFDELPQHWEKTPLPPSAYQPAVPKELDDLVLSLLKLESSARPPSAAFVIDQLMAIAGLAPEHTATTGESYLASAALFGRIDEQHELSQVLEEALAGKGAALVIVGESGVGKTRLLVELAAEAQLAGAVVAHVDAQGASGQLGVARGLCLALLRAAPVEATEAFMRHGAMLGHVLPELGVTERSSLPSEAFSRRSTLQRALLLALGALQKVRPLVLLVDDVDRADDASLLLLNALALEAQEQRLMLVATQTPSPASASRPSLSALNRSTREISLSGLRREGTAGLLHSIFGEVPNVERLTTLLHDATAGNPAQLLQLMRHMLERGHIKYMGGTWSLPAALPDDAVPSSVLDALRDRCARLSPAARAIGELMAVYEHPAPSDVLAVASKLPAEQLAAGLGELTAAGLCLQDGQEYRFSQDAFRQALSAELSAARATQVHLELAAALEGHARSSANLEVKLAHHLIRGGEELAGARRLDKAADRLRFEGVDLVPAARAVEAALIVFERHQQSWAQCMRLRIKLVMWAPFTDAHLTDRYAEETAVQLYEYSGLATAERLRGLGRGPALVLGLVWATLRRVFVRTDKRGLGPVEAVKGFLRVLTPALGVLAIRLNSGAVQRLMHYAAPLQGFPRNNAARAIYVFGRGHGEYLRGYAERAKASFREFLAMVDRFGYVSGARPDEIRELRFGGRVSLSQALMREADQELVELIDQLADDGAELSVVAQHQMRAAYHIGRAEWTKSQEAWQQFERASASVADIWQFEQIMLPYTGVIAFASGDSPQIKRIAERLRTVASDIPSLLRVQRLLHLAYRIQHGRASEVVEEIEAWVGEVPPFSDLIWLELRCAQAYAYRQLGDYERVRKICEAMLAEVKGEVRSSDIGVTFGHWILADALIELGDPTQALVVLDALLAEVEPTGSPLLLARTYGLSALACRTLGDVAGNDRNLALMQHVCAESAHPVLLGQMQRYLEGPTSSSVVPGSPPPAADMTTSQETLIVSTRRRIDRG